MVSVLPVLEHEAMPRNILINWISSWENHAIRRPSSPNQTLQPCGDHGYLMNAVTYQCPRDLWGVLPSLLGLQL